MVTVICADVALADIFGLAAAGIILNLAIVLLLLVVSAGVYISLGSRVRSLKQSTTEAKRVNAIAQSDNLAESVANDSTQPEPSIALPEANPIPEVDTTDAVPLPPEDLKAIQGIFELIPFCNRNNSLSRRCNFSRQSAW